MAGGNKQRAMLLMADHVNAANVVYKNTDFSGDGKPEGELDILLPFNKEIRLAESALRGISTVGNGLKHTENISSSWQD